MASYIEKSILNKWKHLTKGYTSNSAERWNRKIEKVTQGRYGLKSVKFVDQLVVSLWLKSAIEDKRHFDECFIHDINIRKICQENLQTGKIIVFVKNKLLKNIA